ncbi:peptide-methionine (R)-S-oxide reductase MsrB [Hirschia baltica]|uniref:peptide-methionine (R)-S-oxide reductase n=1 Tax=Hirschia baltica (strain ATCC 49814 / DSM 5838 / IFAM 1418) TaxID=582402 RepID=C6XQV3_HIRBI|nr:peptide-methionine (R)-S-oxide reductase MsrB [Hirschia baltica]ACT58709.1 methionine-R-sulfoxide reductase [Hirschia baltica ATCC 49814]
MTHSDKNKAFWLSRRSAFVFLGGGAVFTSGALVANGFGKDPQTTDADTSHATSDAPKTAPGFDTLSQNQWQNLTKADWRDRLSEDAYKILRNEATERPFSSSLNDEKRDGWFACAGCGQILFTSDQKYNSGTGWPSFSDAIPGRLKTKADRKLFYTRTEYHCSRCGGHQGHVFDDGPKPTGKRWCNNGDALVFVPEADLS